MIACNFCVTVDLPEELDDISMEKIIAQAIAGQLYDAGVLTNVCVVLQVRGRPGSSAANLPETPKADISAELRGVLKNKPQP